MSFFITCPHCEHLVEIEKVNCGIFRHATLKQNGQQVPPHLSKNECEKLIQNNQVYGCCKPFRLKMREDNEYVAEICDYI